VGLCWVEAAIAALHPLCRGDDGRTGHPYGAPARVALEVPLADGSNAHRGLERVLMERFAAAPRGGVT
jgi:hypothetical protein